MKILLINDLRVAGGTEVQTKREFELFKSQGHDVSLLTFDADYELCVSRNKEQLYNIPIRLNNFQKIYHRYFTSKAISQNIKEVLAVVRPDVIHINNIVQIPLDVFACVGNIPTVQTLRDYGVICPKSTCIDKSGAACRGYKFGNCCQCIGLNLVNLAKIKILDNINAARCKNIKKFVAPSAALALACTNNGIQTECLNNPFDFKIIKKSVITYKAKNYLYYGKISREKGVSELVRAFDVFSKNHSDAKLIFAGSVAVEYWQEFQKICGKPYVEYRGVLKNADIMALYNEIYCVVVPSLWIENYPNTVLEAIANKTYVIGSNRGGIPELIKNKDALFDVLDKQDIIEKLEYSYRLSDEDYREQVVARYLDIKVNNSLEAYYKKLLKIYNSIV